MRSTLFGPVGLLTLLLVSSFVYAESELAHAIERIYWWSQYQLEHLAFPNSPAEDYWIGPDCKKHPARCDFNEFVSWITRGKLDGAPNILEKKYKADFFTDPKLVVEVAEKMAKIQDPDGKPGALYMANELQVPKTVSGFKSFTGAYKAMVKFDTEIKGALSRWSGKEDDLTKAQLYQKSGKVVLQDILKVREGTNLNLQLQWMEKRFSDIRNLEYEHTDENGNTKRYKEKIVIETKKVNWGSKSWVEIRVEDTQNNDARLSDTKSQLRQKWDKAKNLFNAEPLTARHLSVIKELRKTVGKCK